MTSAAKAVRSPRPAHHKPTMVGPVRKVERVPRRDAAVLPLILACAEEDELALLRSFGSLRVRGFEPELVPGVELDARLFAEAIDATRGPGLFVLVGSEYLDRHQLDVLAATYNARRGPNQRLVVAHFDSRRPLDLVKQISGPAVSLRKEDRRDSIPQADSPENLRDAVAVPNWIQRPEPPVRGPKRVTVRLESPLPPLSPCDPDAPTVEEPVIDEARPPRSFGGAWAVVGGLGAAAVLMVTQLSADPAPARASDVLAPVVASRAAEEIHEEGPVPAPSTPVADVAPGGPASGVEPPPAPVPRDPLARAIGERRVRVLDDMYVAPQHKGGLDWRDAANLCRYRSIDGVRGWRLPRLKQLRSIYMAGMLGDASYWTISKAGEGRNYVLDADAGRTEVWDKATATGRVVCVKKL